MTNKICKKYEQIRQSNAKSTFIAKITKTFLIIFLLSVII